MLKTLAEEHNKIIADAMDWQNKYKAIAGEALLILENALDRYFIQLKKIPNISKSGTKLSLELFGSELTFFVVLEKGLFFEQALEDSLIPLVKCSLNIRNEFPKEGVLAFNNGYWLIPSNMQNKYISWGEQLFNNEEEEFRTKNWEENIELQLGELLDLYVNRAILRFKEDCFK